MSLYRCLLKENFTVPTTFPTPVLIPWELAPINSRDEFEPGSNELVSSEGGIYLFEVNLGFTSGTYTNTSYFPIEIQWGKGSGSNHWYKWDQVYWTGLTAPRISLRGLVMIEPGGFLRTNVTSMEGSDKYIDKDPGLTSFYVSRQDPFKYQCMAIFDTPDASTNFEVPSNTDTVVPFNYLYISNGAGGFFCTNTHRFFPGQANSAYWVSIGIQLVRAGVDPGGWYAGEGATVRLKVWDLESEQYVTVSEKSVFAEETTPAGVDAIYVELEDLITIPAGSHLISEVWQNRSIDNCAILGYNRYQQGSPTSLTYLCIAEQEYVDDTNGPLGIA